MDQNTNKIDEERELDTFTNKKEVYLFGRDIASIPCFRNSFLYGILGGIGSGLVYFLFTSRPQMSSHFAMGSFTLITLGYWTQCRYNYSKTKMEMLRTQALLRKHIMYEGTPKDIDVKTEDLKEA